MGIAIANIRCELREVVLRDKPAEMIAISPKATVPVLQLSDGTVIDESLDIMQWALAQNDPERWLDPESSSLDEALALIEKTETQFKPHLDRYKYPDRYAGTNAAEQRTLACNFLALLEARLEVTPYLFGNRICIADIAIFPFVRQFANTDSDWFGESPFRLTQTWLGELTTAPIFGIAMKKYPQWKSGSEAVFFPE